MFAVGDELLQIHIGHTELVSALCHFGDQMPCMFLQTTLACAERLRDALQMTSPAGPVYYDPECEDDVQRYITVIFESMGESDQGIETYFWCIFSLMQDSSVTFKNGGQLLQVRVLEWRSAATGSCLKSAASCYRFVFENGSQLL